MPDLSLVPIDAMLDEIANRCNAVVLAYQLKEHESHGAIFCYRGGFTRCIGLLHRFLWQFEADDKKQLGIDADGPG